MTMVKYIPRISVNYPTDLKLSKYYHEKPYNTDSVSLQIPNCTTYALGRLSELLDRPITNWQDMPDATDDPIFNRTGFPDAGYWYSSARWKKGLTPLVGGILCWSSTIKGSNVKGRGHVAVVEKIDEDGIWISYSNYSSTNREDPHFNYRVIPHSCYLASNVYDFKYEGCIYPPEDTIYYEGIEVLPVKEAVYKLLAKFEADKLKKIEVIE